MRGRPLGLMFHSEHGTQYTAEPFRKLFDELHVIQSFPKKGYPFDNAVCESFFRQLKWKEADRRTYRSKPKLYLAVFEYIEGFYNSHRPHAPLGLPLISSILTLAVNSFAISFTISCPHFGYRHLCFSPQHGKRRTPAHFPISIHIAALTLHFAIHTAILALSPCSLANSPCPKNTASTRGYRHGCFSVIQSAVTSSEFFQNYVITY